nr:MAG TPA: minor tail protein [Caudoviricetes sp.]
MADNIQLKVQYSDGGALTSLTKINEIAQYLNAHPVKLNADFSALEKATQANNELLSTIRNITSEASKMEQALSKAAQAGTRVSSIKMQEGSSSRYAQASSDISYQAKTVAFKDQSEKIRRIIQQGEESNSQYAGSWGKVDSAQIKAHQSGEQVGGTISKIGTQAEKTGNSLLENAKKFATWMLLGNAISGVKRAFEEALDEMKKADSELVTVRKVTGMAADELERLNKAAFATATKYGESASEYLANVSEFARAGYGDTADKLAELSVKTQIVGDTTADTANQFLLAVDAAYKYNGSITALSRVLDGANEIDNKYATSIEKIAGGLGIVAPVAAQANIGIDELTAAIGTITAVTQRSGTEAATALRAIILNIVGDTKTEIEDGATWTAGQIKGLSDVIKIYAKDAYDAAQASGEVLNPMKAIAGLAQSVKDGVLSASQLYEMVSDIGGKLRASQLTALVQNWDMYESMLTDYASAYGSAEKEIENATDSWERKTKQLQNTWTEFIQKSINTSSIKGLLDLARTILTVTGNLGNAVSIISGLIITFKSSSVVSFFEKLGTSTKTTVDNLKSFGALIRSTLSKEEKRLSLITKTNTYQRIYNQLLKQEAIIQGKTTDEIDENTRAQIANTAAKKTAAAAIVSWIGLAVTAVSAISTAVSAIEAKAAQTRQQIIENSKATAEQVENLTELIQQYETLSKERKDGGAWDNTQISQAKSLQEQITSLVGDQAKQLDIVNGKYEEQIKLLKESLAAEVVKEGFMDASDAEKAALKNAKKAISRYGETVIPDGALLTVAETLKDNRFVKLGEGAYTVDFGAKSQITAAEDALAYFNEVKTLRAALFEDYGDTKLYKELSDYIAKYKDDFKELETIAETKKRYEDILAGNWDKVLPNGSGNSGSGGGKDTTPTTDEVKKLYEELEKAVNKRLDARKKELDAIKEAHNIEKETLDIEEKRLKVAEAQKALESAETERTIRVYNAATGQWEWQADESAIEKAKESLKTAEDNLKEAEWQQWYNEQLRAYEEEKAAYDKIFDAVDDVSDTTRDIDAILADIANKRIPEFSEAFERLKEVFGDAVKGTQKVADNTTPSKVSSRETIDEIISGTASTSDDVQRLKDATVEATKKAAREKAKQKQEEIKKAERQEKERNKAAEKERKILEERTAEIESISQVSDDVMSRISNAGSPTAYSFEPDTLSGENKNQRTFSNVTTNNKTTNNTTSYDRYYYINGFKVGNDATDRPLSEILGVLSIYKDRN